MGPVADVPKAEERSAESVPAWGPVRRALFRFRPIPGSCSSAGASTGSTSGRSTAEVKVVSGRTTSRLQPASRQLAASSRKPPRVLDNVPKGLGDSARVLGSRREVSAVRRRVSATCESSRKPPKGLGNPPKGLGSLPRVLGSRRELSALCRRVSATRREPSGAAESARQLAERSRQTAESSRQLAESLLGTTLYSRQLPR
jgi:hypothetical protein